MGSAAESAVPVLMEILEDIIGSSPPEVPKVEDFFTNAITRALLDIAPNDRQVRSLLNTTLAKPLLETLDLSVSSLVKVKSLLDSGRYLDAYDLLNSKEFSKESLNYFSQGDPLRDSRERHSNLRAYTSSAIFNGSTYRIGTGIAWQNTELVPQDEFRELAYRQAGDYPQALNWRLFDAPNISRVPIYKITPDGKEQKVFLEGESFIFDATDAKVGAWSVALDSEGYIHITGGKHNCPDPDNYIPGSWEKLGLSRNFPDDSYPAMMYWVSKKPEDITTMQFVGQRSNPRVVPVPQGFNYVNFIQDRKGVLYVYGRIHVQGIQSWGLYRYDTLSKKWSPVGSSAPDVKKEFPQWADKYIEMSCDWFALPTMAWKNTAPENTVLAWARQPHFYNFIRGWGIRFDPTNRMHVQVPLFGLDENNYNVNAELYAYSDDAGETFHRADGSRLKLPITSNPGPGNAVMKNHNTAQYWQLWLSLLPKPFKDREM
jgi:hypothetical protein